jgi:hypothetical protein
VLFRSLQQATSDANGHGGVQPVYVTNYSEFGSGLFGGGGIGGGVAGKTFEGTAGAYLGKLAAPAFTAGGIEALIAGSAIATIVAPVLVILAGATALLWPIIENFTHPKGLKDMTGDEMRGYANRTLMGDLPAYEQMMKDADKRDKDMANGTWAKTKLIEMKKEMAVKPTNKQTKEAEKIEIQRKRKNAGIVDKAVENYGNNVYLDIIVNKAAPDTTVTARQNPQAANSGTKVK